jgi:hypothetical protein
MEHDITLGKLLADNTIYTENYQALPEDHKRRRIKRYRLGFGLLTPLLRSGKPSHCDHLRLKRRHIRFPLSTQIPVLIYAD